VSPSDLAEAIGERHPDVVLAHEEVSVVTDRGDLLEALVWLRTAPGIELDLLSSVTATHWPGRTPAFWVAYELRSRERHHRARVKVGLAAEDAVVPTVTGLFPTANWLERETFDFYGIVFDGHPDLSRILLPADWQGHPLRKDEPLGGVPTWFQGVRVPPIDERGMA
jgi:NADH-quinone oxidoreductase subunit C